MNIPFNYLYLLILLPIYVIIKLIFLYKKKYGKFIKNIIKIIKITKSNKIIISFILQQIIIIILIIIINLYCFSTKNSYINLIILEIFSQILNNHKRYKTNKINLIRSSLLENLFYTKKNLYHNLHYNIKNYFIKQWEKHNISKIYYHEFSYIFFKLSSIIAKNITNFAKSIMYIIIFYSYIILLCYRVYIKKIFFLSLLIIIFQIIINIILAYIFLIKLNYLLIKKNKINIKLGNIINSLLNNSQIKGNYYNKKILNLLNQHQKILYQINKKQQTLQFIKNLLRIIIILIFTNIQKNNYISKNYFIFFFPNINFLLLIFLNNKNFYQNLNFFSLFSNKITKNIFINTNNDINKKKKININNFFLIFSHNTLSIFKKNSNQNKQQIMNFHNFQTINWLSDCKLNLILYQGDQLILHGPSGSGKSIFLKSILNNLFIKNGKILYNKKIHISYLGENISYFSKIENNLIKNLIIKNTNLDQYNRLFNINYYKIIHNKKININNLSNGQKAQLLLLKFFSQKNLDIILIDEFINSIKLPMNNIDNIIKEIFKHSKKSVLIISDSYIKKFLYNNPI